MRGLLQRHGYAVAVEHQEGRPAVHEDATKLELRKARNVSGTDSPKFASVFACARSGGGQTTKLFRAEKNWRSCPERKPETTQFL